MNMSIQYENIGKRIKKFRIDRNLSQEKLAEMLIPLQGADFLEKQLANVFELDEKTVNDYLDCNNIGFDCTMLYIKNRVEEAGISLVLIDVDLGVSMYGLTLQILYLVVSYPYKYTLVC